MASSSIRVTLDTPTQLGSSSNALARVLQIARSPWMARITALALFLGAWQWASVSFETLLMPSIGEVVTAVWALAETGVVVESFTVSLVRLAIGFSATVVLGMVVGIAVGRYRLVEAALHDFVVIGISFPYLITALLCAMWFGWDGISPILILIISAIPYVILNMSEGVKAVDKRLVDMARAYGASERSILRHVVLPTTYPFLFAALRMTFSVGWRALIMGEVFAATMGAGNKLSFYWSVGNAAEVVAMAVYFAIFAQLMERLFARMSNRVFRWRPDSVRTTSTSGT